MNRAQCLVGADDDVLRGEARAQLVALRGDSEESLPQDVALRGDREESLPQGVALRGELGECRGRLRRRRGRRDDDDVAVEVVSA